MSSQQVLESKEYSAVTHWLSGHTENVGDVLDAFCEPVENKFFQTENASDVEGLLWTAWQALVGEAASTPHTSTHQRKLVDMVMGLAHRPTLTKGDNTCTIDGMTVWKDLPVLGWQLREAWNISK
jgi:hypothetical protein